MYQVVRFGRGYGRQSGQHRRSTVSSVNADRDEAEITLSDRLFQMVFQTVSFCIFVTFLLL